ncbi:MAG: hypothetical protein ACO1TE_28870 [Prosthecobacter sp.]
MRLLLPFLLFAFPAVSEAGQTLLLVDDHEILYRPGTRRQLHVPKRHMANPLITGPTLKNQVSYCSVYRDPQSGLYQVWYQMSGKDTVVCYAESKDGIEWTKPELDLIKLPDISDRNVVLSSVEQYGASVVVDAPGENPQRRYKMAYWSIPLAVAGEGHPKDPRGNNGGMHVAFSPDGIHWTKHEGPVLRGAYGRAGEPPLVGEDHFFGVHTSVSDVLDASYDRLRKKYVVYAKAWVDGPDGMTYWKRSIVRTESDDFLRWSPPQLVMAPDEHDGIRPAAYPGTRQGVQLHGAPVFVHHDVYFSLVQVADFEAHGLQPIELAISRDGITWQRPFRQQLFMPAVEGGNGFDAARIWSNATPVFLEDEIRIYYGGAENPWHFGKRENEWGSKKRLPKTGMGLATLPLDRFAGVRPLEKIGQITLRPHPLAGMKGITLNADAAAGSVRVELLDAKGYRIPGFTKADATPITGNGLRHPVAWKKATLKDLPAGDVMIRIHLDNAEAFAVTLN